VKSGEALARMRDAYRLDKSFYHIDKCLPSSVQKEDGAAETLPSSELESLN
jgi:hypothetical protein